VSTVPQDHPLRLARLRARMPAARLAAMAKVNRSTLIAIEGGRTRFPDPSTLRRLEAALGVPADSLGPQLQAWRRRQKPTLSLRQRAVLDLSPAVLASYGSFVAWRRDLGYPTPTSLASALHLPQRTVDQYEKGLRKRDGLPQTLAMGLIEAFDLGDAYVAALSELPPGPGDARP
jgi:transcriptional regulator with XRE-family HTH domain